MWEDGISTALPLNATSTERREESSSTTETNENWNCLSRDERKAALQEIAALTGEQFTVECRLQYINNRLDFLRKQLTADRRHGNSKG